MTEYNQKIICNLKPQWYCELSGKEKDTLQREMRSMHNEEWLDKPKPIARGTELIVKAGVSGRTITAGKKYRVMNHFCTLVTTVYASTWHQFVTIKNNAGYTVKVNLSNFKKIQ